MLCGILFRVYEFKAWFALSNYEIDAQSQELEQRLWEIFPQRDVDFWPYLLKDSEALRDFLERDMPVSVNTQMLKLGKFKTEIKWLEPWVKVHWREKFWYISRDGKMWALDDEINRNFHGNDPKIIWRIPKDLPNPDFRLDYTGAGVSSDDTMPLFGVFKTPLPTNMMENFLNYFRDYSWFEFVSEVTWERRAGSDLFVLNLERNSQKFKVFIQRDKYSEQDLGLLIEDVFEELAREGGNHIIDATYEGKIVIKAL